jgi:hypothetical protein
MRFRQLGVVKYFSREAREAREEQRWLKRNLWNGLVPGDTVMYKQRRLMFLSMSDDATIYWRGPGLSAGREPVFVEPGTNPLCVYYIRTARDISDVFKESAPAAQLENTGLVVKFLNPAFESIPALFRKTGHLAPEEWNALRPSIEGIRT